jgi:hypothetical protein
MSGTLRKASVPRLGLRQRFDRFLDCGIVAGVGGETEREVGTKTL